MRALLAVAAATTTFAAVGAAAGAPPPNPHNCRGIASATKPTTGRDFGQAQAALAQQQLRDGANNGLSNCGNSGRRNP